MGARLMQRFSKSGHKTILLNPIAGRKCMSDGAQDGVAGIRAWQGSTPAPGHSVVAVRIVFPLQNTTRYAEVYSLPGPLPAVFTFLVKDSRTYTTTIVPFWFIERN